VVSLTGKIMRTRATFDIRDKIVYPMHGIGWVANMLTQTRAGQPRHFYQIVLTARVRRNVLVPVAYARAGGVADWHFIG
jgi:RNA polymerase-interacting CarD/CdnL/TRCF family regulator